MTEIACGKCPECGDQLITVISFTPPEFRRTICPTCTLRQLDELLKRQSTVILSREEVDRCAE